MEEKGGFGMIALQQIGKRYNAGSPDEVRVLENLSLKLETGSFNILLGANGSGKSTLLNLLAGTERASQGSILLNGQDIGGWPVHRRAAHIARIFQDPLKGVAPGLSLLENMRLAALRGKSHRLLIGTGRGFQEEVRERLRQLDMGLEDRIHQPAGSFSGGQRQAFSLLMATWNKPDLLLLDEPTAALDPRSATKVFELACMLIARDQITALLVTHDLRHALQAGNRVLFLRSGELVHDVQGANKQALSMDDIRSWFE